MILAALATLFVMQQTDFRGDEYTCTSGARALGDALAGRAGWAFALDEVIGTGWFMPGASIILAPLYALLPEPGFLAIRARMLALAMLLA